MKWVYIPLQFVGSGTILSLKIVGRRFGTYPYNKFRVSVFATQFQPMVSAPSLISTWVQSGFSLWSRVQPSFGIHMAPVFSLVFAEFSTSSVINYQVQSGFGHQPPFRCSLVSTFSPCVLSGFSLKPPACPSWPL